MHSFQAMSSDSSKIKSLESLSRPILWRLSKIPGVHYCSNIKKELDKETTIVNGKGDYHQEEM